MTKNLIPVRPQGWKFAGRAGIYHVWHAGKNDYRITDSAQGDVIAIHDQFGAAHAFARRQDDLMKPCNMTAHNCVPWRGRGGNIGACVYCGQAA